MDNLPDNRYYFKTLLLAPPILAMITTIFYGDHVNCHIFFVIRDSLLLKMVSTRDTIEHFSMLFRN